VSQVKLVICEPFRMRCGAVNAQMVPNPINIARRAKRVADIFRREFIQFSGHF